MNNRHRYKACKKKLKLGTTNMKLSFASIAIVTIQITAQVLVKGLAYTAKLLSILIPVIVSVIVSFRNQTPTVLEVNEVPVILPVPALSQIASASVASVLLECEDDDVWSIESEPILTTTQSHLPEIKVILALPPASLSSPTIDEPKIKTPDFSNYNLKELKRYCNKHGIVPEGNKSLRSTWLNAAIASWT
jgi:hypothetical protein